MHVMVLILFFGVLDILGEACYCSNFLLNLDLQFEYLLIFLGVYSFSLTLTLTFFRISVIFVDKDGVEKHIKVPIGMSMLEAAHQNDIELEGEDFLLFL